MFLKVSKFNEKNEMREERARAFASLLRGRARVFCLLIISFSSLKTPALLTNTT
mgnify:CR=1 FL=1